MKFSAAGWRVFATVVTTAVVALALSSAAVARPNVSRDLITPGTLLVGSDIPYPPFEFGAPPHYKGFDIDVVNAVARKLHLRVKYKDTSFDTIFTDVRRRKFDLVASAATITRPRKRYVSFSKPYYDAQQSLVVRKGSHIDSVRDLAGKTVGVQNGTAGYAFARNHTHAAKVFGFPNGPAAIHAVKRGRVDATIVDQPVARDARKKGQAGFRIAQNISTGMKYGFAMSKASPRLRRGVNRALNRIKADGTFKHIYRKWFGIKPPRSLRR